MRERMSSIVPWNEPHRFKGRLFSHHGAMNLPFQPINVRASFLRKLRFRRNKPSIRIHVVIDLGGFVLRQLDEVLLYLAQSLACFRHGGCDLYF